jgi:hypothetical protein
MSYLTSVALLSLGLAPIRGADEPPERAEARKHLKAVADYLAAEVKGDSRPFLPEKDLDALIAYVQKQKDDDAVRKEAIAVAMKHAKVSEYREPPDNDPLAAHSHHNHGRAVTVWKLLLTTDVLKKGMTVEEAVKILGKANNAGKDYVQWYAPTHLRFSTMLTGQVRDGRIEEFTGVDTGKTRERGKGRNSGAR